MSIFVITYPESGWDCVGGIYEADSKEQVLEFIAEERGETMDNLNDVIVHEVFEITKLN